jgi:hypothetical protein
MRMRLFLLLVVLLLVSGSLNAMEYAKNPYKAMLFSALLPGGGQVYNNAYIKAVAVVGLQAYLVNSAFYNHDKMEQFEAMMDGSGSFDDLLYQSRRDKYRDNLRSDYWWIGTVMVLSVADAFVDAHLYNFKAEKDKVRLKFEDKMLRLEYRF